jgi:general stress protein YciG
MAQKSQGTGTSNRGFASMDAAKQREIASKGGQSVPAAKRSFSQDRRLAAEAGRKGGQSSHGGGRKTADTEQVAGATQNQMTPEREEHHDTVHGEPEKVDSH